MWKGCLAFCRKTKIGCHVLEDQAFPEGVSGWEG